MAVTQRIKQDTHRLVKLAHLLFVIAVIPLLLTGLRIAVANEPQWVWLSMALPQGAMHEWHFRFGLLLLAALGLYLAWALLTGRWPPLRHSRSLEVGFRLTHYLGLILLLLSAMTGSLLVLGLDNPPRMWLVHTHLWSALSLVLYLVLHPVLSLITRPWRTVLRYFAVHRLPGVAVLVPVSLALAVATLIGWSLYSEDRLTVVRTDTPVTVDGEAREAVWQQAERRTLTTYQGYHQPAEGTPVTIQASHDGTRVYFYLRWPDPTRSQTHLPLIKTDEGWTVLHTAFDRADENVFYEDKLALMLSRSDQPAGAGTIGLGAKPLPEFPATPNGRGLHYTTDGSIADVWHWKSVRTGASLGQADDNVFGPPTPTNSEYDRYTGGYQKDQNTCEHLLRFDGQDYRAKPDCGGYQMNWRLFKTGLIQPLRLPASPSLLERLGKVDRDPDTSDFGRWYLNWDETIPYDPDADRYPVGTVMPSVLTLGPFQHGRGGVRAVGHWRAGEWHLEMSRSLAVDSQYDLPIETGMHLWVSTFDHSQTRHSYHLRPLRLVLE